MPGSYYSDVERTIYLTYVILMEDVAKYDELFQQERKFISFEFWGDHCRTLDYDDLVYGHEKLSELVAKYPETKDGLSRYLYEIVLRRMEIRDRSRSVNSIDVIFNFDCIGFTGTPFIDNYPTFAYIRAGRKDDIPDMINREFYAYSSDNLSQEKFEERFASFQGQNRNVRMEYVSSDFVTASSDELAIFQTILHREQQVQQAATLPPLEFDEKGEVEDQVPLAGEVGANMNVLVDLCGVFKRSTIHQIRDLILQHFGPDRFHYIYHIDQADSNDRVLSIASDQDVQFDEEFYNHLCKTYGAGLRERVFFFVDNRNVIGKDVPFQLAYQRIFGQPMFSKSVVLAHDVDDFSKIWQAMGRSRTMNATKFTIYKAPIASAGGGAVEAPEAQPGVLRDIKELPLTRQLYVQNCDQKMAGNLSSIYQTLISLLNLSSQSFYFMDDIVNTFLEKMQMTIAGKLARHEQSIAEKVCCVCLCHTRSFPCRRALRPRPTLTAMSEPGVGLSSNGGHPGPHPDGQVPTKWEARGGERQTLRKGGGRTLEAHRAAEVRAAGGLW